jgi:hypothetical protein
MFGIWQRFDVTTAVMTLSSFRACPRKGHLDRAKRVVAYLYQFKFAKIRFRTHEPDYSDLVVPDYDWARSVYGDAKEDIPRDAPEPLGKPVVTTSYVDANLLHDLVTGRSITGILHFLNGTPINWYSKKMATVETATYGAEFVVSARTCVEQLVDLRKNTLRYLGVPLREKSCIFGDNESVVNSSIQPHAKLHKGIMLSRSIECARQLLPVDTYSAISQGRTTQRTFCVSTGVIRQCGTCSRKYYCMSMGRLSTPQVNLTRTAKLGPDKWSTGWYLWY